MSLNFGIIGAGRMGIRHIEAINRIPQIEVKGIFDINRGLGEKISQKYGVPLFSELNDLLTNDSIHAVSVCTPNHLHLEPVTKSLKNRKHVLVEKPMATSIADCDVMIHIQKESNCELMVGHTHRFYPIHQKAKEIIDSGRLGRLMTISIYGINPGFFPNKNLAPAWIREKEAMPGVLMLDAIHYVDLVQWWFGNEISDWKLVFSSQIDNDLSIENIASFFGKTADNRLAQVFCDNASPGIAYSRFTLVFEKGIVESDFSPKVSIGQKEWKDAKLDFSHIPNEPVTFSHNLRGFVNEIVAFKDTIEKKINNPIPGEIGKRNLHNILNLYDQLEGTK